MLVWWYAIMKKYKYNYATVRYFDMGLNTQNCLVD